MEASRHPSGRLAVRVAGLLWKYRVRGRPSWLHYGVAVALTAATLLIYRLFLPLDQARPASDIFLVAVVLSAYFGGLGPGLLSTALGALAADYFLLFPIDSLRVASPIDQLRLAALFLVGVLISLLSESLHRSKEQLARDNAKRVHVEEKLREYEKAVEGLEEMIVVIDRDYRYLLANRAFLKYRNLEREDLEGHLLAEMVDRNVFDQVIKAKLDESFTGEIVHYELRLKYAHLGERDLRVSLFPVEGPSRVERVACVLQDITERKLAEKKIREEQKRAQRYLDIADVILLALDLEGRIALINRKACSLLGWEESELLGRDWVDMCLPERIRPALRTAFHNLVGGDLSPIENPIFTKTGEERMIRWSNSQLRDEEGRVIGTLSSGEDITERKKAEDQLQRLAGQLLRLQDEERRKLARDLHDSTGQNLVALKAVLGRLRRTTPAPGREALQLITELQALTGEVIQEIRTLSYLLHPPMLDEAGLEVAVRLYSEGVTKRTGIPIILEVSTSFGRLQPDVELALFRVIQEGVTNVVRHSGSLRAKIRLYRNRDEVIVEILDMDHKKPGASLPFTPGVGISSMQERVKQIGGRLVIESGERGTTVRVTIPARNDSFMTASDAGN
jgi:PAS domain S-box-containing protein